MREILLIVIATAILISSGYANRNNAQFIGYWVGTLRVMEEESECQIEFIAEDDEIKGYMSIPLQLMKDYPLINLQIDHPEISFALSQGGVTATFNGSMKSTYISGTFEQAGMGGLFHLVRGERNEAPPEVVISGESEVHIRTHFGNIYGSLLVPEGSQQIPVVLIIAGSGPTNRDGNNPMMGEGFIYRDLALQLQKHGIASLRFDKRGIGASSGAIVREEDIRFDYYVNDVVQWVEKLQEYDNFSSIILLGHSEGSLLGIVAGGKVPVSGLISVAGMGRTFGEVLKDQMSQQPEPYQSAGIEIVESLENGVMVPNVMRELQAAFRPEIQPYIISMMRFNPTVEIAKLDIPILILQGTTDLQVKQIDAEKLHQANKNSKKVIIDSMNHVMRTSSLDMQQNFITYGTPGLPFSDGFIESVIAFIKEIK